MFYTIKLRNNDKINTNQLKFIDPLIKKFCHSQFSKNMLSLRNKNT